MLTPALSVAVTIGETRYRALAEVALVLGAAVTIDALVSQLRPRPRSFTRGDDADELLPTEGSAPNAARVPAEIGPPGF